MSRDVRKDHEFYGPTTTPKTDRLNIVNHAEAWLRKGKRPGLMVETLSGLNLITPGNNVDITSVTRQDDLGQATEIEVRSYKFRDPNTRAEFTAHVPEPSVLRQMILNS